MSHKTSNLALIFLDLNTRDKLISYTEVHLHFFIKEESHLCHRLQSLSFMDFDIISVKRFILLNAGYLQLYLSDILKS